MRRLRYGLTFSRISSEPEIFGKEDIISNCRGEFYLQHGIICDFEKFLKLELSLKQSTLKKYYDVWSATEDKTKAQLMREKMAYPAPKLPLPGHAERFVFSVVLRKISNRRYELEF